MAQWNDENDRMFHLLLNKLKKSKGLDFSQYRPACLKRRIDTRLRVHHLKNYQEYMLFLSKNPAEFDEFLNAATINVSEFFRDAEAWDYIQDTLLPLIIQNIMDKNQHSLRIWCAGCSSGEEAYTLAILIHEVFGENIKKFNIKIYGTDIDKASLKCAQIGSYLKDSVKNIKADRLKRYFDFNGEHYIVTENLRKLISFKNHDLVLGEPLNHMDLIVCRNVLIYFSKELQQKIITKFSSALKPHGFLMLGKTESFGTHVKEHFNLYDSLERIYQKR